MKEVSGPVATVCHTYRDKNISKCIRVTKVYKNMHQFKCAPLYDDDEATRE